MTQCNAIPDIKSMVVTACARARVHACVCSSELLSIELYH